MKKQIIIVITIGLLLISIILGIVFVNKDKTKKEESNEPNIIVNDSPGIVESREVDGILFSEIRCLIQEDGSTIIDYLITNNRNEEVTLNEYELIFMDENDEVIGNFTASIPITIPANSTVSTENNATIDLEKAKKMEVKLN